MSDNDTVETMLMVSEHAGWSEATMRTHWAGRHTGAKDLPLSGTGWYFKAGAYVQSNTSTGDRPPANAQVVVCSLTVTHS